MARSSAFGTLLFCCNAALGAQFDLVTNNTVTVPGSPAANAIFDKSNLQPSGTGVFNPFLRLQQSGNDNFERAFNTSALGNPPDGLDAKNGVWTHDLLLSSLAVVNRGGTNYIQFHLDLGEPGNSSSDNARLILQTFNLYTGNNDAPTAAEIMGNPANLGTFRFGLGGNTVLLFDENSGNGQADVLISVPAAAFTGVTHTYLYLYTELGVNAGGNPFGGAGGSFEEFSALQGPGGGPGAGPGTTVPDGGTTLTLLGAALVGLVLIRRKLGN